jgi:hypothetical protein
MRHNFQIYIAVLQNRDDLATIKSDANKKYKLPETAAVISGVYAFFVHY